MAITGPTQQQYENFLSNGGTLEFTLESTDISSDNAFENFELIKPYLYTGFELRPSSVIHEPKEAAQLYVYGDTWTRITTFVYRNGGKIVYKKLLTGNFLAECSVPV